MFGRSFSQSVYGGSSAATDAIHTVSDRLYAFSSHWDSEGADSVPAQIAASAGLTAAIFFGALAAFFGRSQDKT